MRKSSSTSYVLLCRIIGTAKCPRHYRFGVGVASIFFDAVARAVGETTTVPLKPGVEFDTPLLIVCNATVGESPPENIGANVVA